MFEPMMTIAASSMNPQHSLGMFFGVLILAFLAFTLSASAGLGGSLILVPAMAMVLGPKEGIAMASALLSMNNVGKVLAYRHDIPYRAAMLVLSMTVIGAVLGSMLLIAVPSSWVSLGVVLIIACSFISDRVEPRVRRLNVAPLALLAGATSGFSGTSGPLKGVAIRSLSLDRRQFVGAASIVSFAGDTAKVVVYSSSSVFPTDSMLMIASAFPLMIAAVLLGKRINRIVGERGYTALFWAVMVGYSVRLVLL